MALDISTDLESFEGFLDKDLSGDCEYLNQSQLYNLYICDFSDNVSITFLEKTAYVQILELLKNLYHLVPNVDNTGLTTTVEIANKKTVITIYNNRRKLLIQGPGCSTWTNTIFRHLSSKLVPKLTEEDEDNNKKVPIQNTTANTSPKDICSPPSIISKKNPNQQAF